MSERTVSSPIKSLFLDKTLTTHPAPSPDPNFFFSSPVPSIRGSVPPTKKPRFTSTASSSSFSVSTPRSSSSARIEPVDDLHRARRASSLRVLDIWSSLAARYNRRLDEDDIIDISTGDVIKDRGVLRELPQQFEIGHFADADDPLNLNDASSEGDGAQTEAEDDVDEIDAFAPENDITKELRLESRAVPPVQVMDPADADDLREFMEAERLRRELDGEEDSEDDFDVPVNSELDVSSIYDSSDPPEYDNDPTLEQQEALRNSEAPVDDDNSEDEFAAWDIDEGNTIYQVVPEPVLDIEDEESSLPSPHLVPSSLQSMPPLPTVIKSPTSRASVSPKQKAASPKRERRTGSTLPAQLHTPPQSTSSLLDFSLDDIDVQFPTPHIPVRSNAAKLRPPPNSPENPFQGGSDAMSPQNAITSEKTINPRPKFVPTVVIPHILRRSLQGTSTCSSPKRRREREHTREKVVHVPPQNLQEITEQGDGPSKLRNRDSLSKPRRKSARPEIQSFDERNSSPPRRRKRKRTTSSSEDVSGDNCDRGEYSQASNNDKSPTAGETNADSGTVFSRPVAKLLF
jgi:Centromere protein Scm3